MRNLLKSENDELSEGSKKSKERKPHRISLDSFLPTPYQDEDGNHNGLSLRSSIMRKTKIMSN